VPAVPFALAAALALALCAGPTTPPTQPAPGLDADTTASDSARAAALVADATLVDTHIDTPDRLRTGTWEDVAGPTAHGHFDYPRARAGGLDVAFMSVYVPAALQEAGGARAYADALIDTVEAVARRAPDRFALVHTADAALAVGHTGRVGLALGIENGAALEGDVDALAHFYDRGVRYITLTHSQPNSLADPSYGTRRPWGGLSPLGEEVVAEMNRLGMMVDVSHLSDAAFDDALRVSRAPVIASHSSARRFTPGWERNLDDGRIRALARAGGVLQISFGSMFITPAYQRAADRGDASPPRGTVSDVADHVDHVVRLVGIDHVGLGSDFDGVPSVPVGLEDVSRYPALVAELLRRGYAEDDVRKLLGENLLRVWRDVERAAEGR
jgi:membrane dipeptidase